MTLPYRQTVRHSTLTAVLLVRFQLGQLEKNKNLKKGDNMLVVHSDRMGITNLNAVSELKLMGRYIRAVNIHGDNHAIAAYETEERAMAVFRTLMDQCRLTKGDDVILLPEV